MQKLITLTGKILYMLLNFIETLQGPIPMNKIITLTE